MIDYDALDVLAQKWLLNRKAHLLRERGFIYRHGKRVAVGVIELRKRITDDASHDDALRISAMFHDIGKGIEPHAQSGAALVQALLADQLEPALLEEVAGLIGAHCDRDGTEPWANLLQDADLIDHFGSIEVVLSSQYGAYTENGIDDALDYYTHHYAAHAARWRATLHSDAARAVYDDRDGFVRQYIDRLLVEAAGGYYI